AVLDSGLVQEDLFLKELAQRLHLPWEPEPLPNADRKRELIHLVSSRVALRHWVLPLDVDETEEGTVALACYDPLDWMAREMIGRELDRPLRWVISPRAKLREGLEAFFGIGADTFDEILQERGAIEEEIDDETTVLDEEDTEASVIRFVNEILRDALKQRATDIHVEPLSDQLRIRYRIDGVLQEAMVPEQIKSLQASVIARIKVMARLDIAEKRLPQDGRISLELDGRPIDVRVATVPSVEGESVSLRLLGQETFHLDRLGMFPKSRSIVERLLAQPNGIVLVTGPTGSGKSTTLYSFLNELNDGSQRIVTIEDPVENKLPGVVQIAVKPEIELTFAAGLRSVLRADPNVIMVGEIRDLETAEIAIRSALTGHLVFSTLHTNDALGGITRLIDMGVEPFLVGASVRAFLAQRLVRRLCEHCKEARPASEVDLAGFVLPTDRTELLTVKPGGCRQCRGTGFRGRLAIYEMVRMTADMQSLVAGGFTSRQLRGQATEDGFETLRSYGWQKVLDGETTVEEVVGATALESL
ncbi:MAG: GspE/PulE family protein, partial [Verrucomicrobiota bacterium]